MYYVFPILTCNLITKNLNTRELALIDKRIISTGQTRDQLVDIIDVYSSPDEFLTIDGVIVTVYPAKREKKTNRIKKEQEEKSKTHDNE